MTYRTLVVLAAVFALGASYSQFRSTPVERYEAHRPTWHLPARENQARFAVPFSIDLGSVFFAPFVAAGRGIAAVGPANAGLGLLSILIAVLLLRKQRRKREGRKFEIVTPAQPDSVRGSGYGSQYVERQVQSAQTRTYVEAPRALFENPYGAEYAGLTLNDRVRVAIEASLRASRVIGVIVFHLPRVISNGRTMEVSERQVEELAALLRSKLRQTDGVVRLGDGSIAVFISLLATKGNLNKIAHRLYTETQQFFISAPASQPLAPGTAMYPIDGYEPEDLIAAAHARMEDRKAAILLQASEYRQSMPQLSG